jgi:cytochrome P450
VIVWTNRLVLAPSLQLGEWVVPQGQHVFVGIDLVHQDESVYPDAGRFDPDRFLGVRPEASTWLPFGGGERRCVGAAFANFEMAVVLRTLLREFEFRPTSEADEQWKWRGVAYAPAKGGRAVVTARSGPSQVSRAVATSDAQRPSGSASTFSESSGS